MKDTTRIIDIEVSPNYFLFGSLDNKGNTEYFEVIDTPDYKINQLSELYKWMEDKQFIGYNCLEYDALVLEKIFDKIDEGDNVNNADIFEIGQDIINSGRPFRWEHQLRHKWLDLLQMNHWGVKSAKTASLKWLQFSTNQNILDLPYKWDEVLTLEQIKEVRNYCLYSDIPATKKIYDLCQSELKIRMDVGKEEKLNLINASEPKIARKLFSKHLSKELGIDEKELKELKTLDVPFKGSDVLLPYISFKNPIFQKLHNDVKNLRISEDSKFKRTVDLQGLKLDYGLGGLHGFRYPKIWEENDEYVIIDSDVKSYYPNLCIRNNKYPRHLGDTFGKIYEGYYNKRIAIPKKDPRNYVLKIVLNAGYGQFLDKYSFLFDRQLGMMITLNGQLLLTMFIEMLSEVGYAINCNTDGVISMIKRDKVDRYYEICKEWEKLTKLELEHETYKKYISYDINNFIGVTTSGESKCKGRFEFEPMMQQKVNVLHKNKSELIVAKAIHDHFVKNIPIENTIYNHNDIFDFCIGERSQWDSHFESIEIKASCLYTEKEKKEYLLKKGYYEYYGYWKLPGSSELSVTLLDPLFDTLLAKDNYINRERLPKTIRYYISNKGKVFKKVYDDGREQFCVVHPQKGKTYNQTLFNKIEIKDIKEYDIDYTYYLKQARKEIDVFKANQTSLL